MLGAVEIDVTALWHTVVIAFAAGMVCILGTGSVIFSLDRAAVSRARAGWLAVAAAGAVVVAGVVVLGIGAMTRK
jgi:hypothetical protein